MQAKFWMLLLAALIGTSVLTAQYPQLRHFTREDGLPSNNVYSIIQDDRGYIWVCTDQGIACFNGQSFEVFTIHDGLTDNDVWALRKDQRGRIWMDSFRGVCYLEEGKIHQFELPEHLQKVGIVSHQITALGHHIKISTDRKPYLFRVGTELESLRYARGYAFADHNGYVVSLNERYNDRPGFKDHQKQNFFPGSNPTIIFENAVVERNTSWLLRLENRKIARGTSKFEFTGTLNDSTILVVRDGQVWQADNAGLHPIDLTYLWPDQPEVEVKEVHALNEQNIVIRTDRFGMLVDRQWQPIPEFEFLRTLDFNRIYLDQEQNLWIGTRYGLFMVSKPARQSKSFSLTAPWDAERIDRLALNSRGRLWGLSSRGNLYRLEDNRGWERLSPAPLLSAPTDLTFDPQDNLYVCGRRSYFYPARELYATPTPVIRKQGVDRFKSAVKGIRFDHQQNTYLVSGQSFGSYEAEQAEPYTMIAKGRFYDMAPRGEDQFWLGGTEGLRLVSHSRQYLPIHTADPLDDRIKQPINNVETDLSGALWWSTTSRGVFRMDERGIHEIEELQRQIIYRLYLDTDQRLWVGTDQGLARVTVLQNDPFRYELRWFTKFDGLASNRVMDVLLRGEEVIAATDRGLTLLQNIDDVDSLSPRPFFFSHLSINGRDTSMAENLVLDFHQNRIDLAYDCLDFSQRSNMQFEYQLEGYDEDWQVTESFHREYLSLPPGAYNFRVRRKWRSGLANTPELSFPFLILPPWWLQAPFLFLVVALTSSLIFLFARYLIRRTQRISLQRSALNQKFAELELRALQAQMNPHFIFNALHAIQDFIFRKNERVANRYLVKFSRLMRLFLESSKEKYIRLAEEVKLLQLYVELEKLRFEDKFDFQINISQSLATSMIEIPSMLLQPFVENAINHGLVHRESNGLLRVDFALEERTLHCTIEDNGIGRQRAMEIKSQSIKSYKSRGMQLVEERQRVWKIIGKAAVDIHITDLRDAAGEARGTRVDIRIKLDD